MSALEQAVPPLLDRGGGLVVGVGDGAGGHAGALQYPADALDPPGGGAGEVHLDDGPPSRGWLITSRTVF